MSSARFRFRAWLLTVAVGLGGAAASAAMAASDPLSAFPAAPKGEIRWVIDLPAQPDEALWQVEVMAGKTMSVDCNRHRLMGRLESKDLQGWGYTYLVFKSKGQAASTRMACPDNARHDAFVTAPSLTQRYNSRLPIVVYAPEGFAVKYRLWQGRERPDDAERR